MPRPRVRLLSYKAGSRSAREIARGAGVLRIRAEGTTFRPRDGDLIVNWGSSEAPSGRYWAGPVQYLNHPDHVAVAVDKREALRKFTEAGVPTLDFTVDIAEANRWYDAGTVVVQRNTARGRGGEGIVVCDPSYPHSEGGNVPDGRGVLWTKYFKRAHEYRVHVWRGEVLDVQLKRKAREADHVDTQIRSHNTGWVFCREGVHAPERVLAAAIRAVDALVLDFGAVDVGYSVRRDRAAVFEVNTAPGVEGTTVEKYAQKIREGVTRV